MKIRAKLSLLICLVLLVTMMPIAVFTVRQMHRTRMDAAGQLTSSIARSVVDIEVTAASEGRTVPDHVLGAHIKTSARLNPSIAYIVVTDDAGRLRTGYVNRDILSVQSELQGDALLLALASEGAGRSKDLLVYNMDIEKGANLAGRVKVAFNLKPFVSQMRHDIIRFGVILVLMLLAGVYAAIVVAGRMSDPLERMAAAMKRVEAGDLEVAVDVQRSDEIGHVAAAMNQMVQGLKEKEWLRSTFTKYVSHQVADKIMNDGMAADFDGEMRHVSVMFCDMRGFTAISENMAPKEVIKLLNEYFKVIVEVVFKYDGMIDKFVGDQIMVVYGAPVTLEDSALRAVATAVEAQNRIKDLNDARIAAGLPVVNLGIGINSGDVVAGNVGSHDRTNYTVIGDQVNLAQRIESQSPKGEILISEMTYEQVKDNVVAESLGPVKMKGREKPIEVYRVSSVRY